MGQGGGRQGGSGFKVILSTHARETERAVYEANVNSELHYRSRIQEQKFLYLYKIARKFKVHGKLNDGVIDR